MKKIKSVLMIIAFIILICLCAYFEEDSSTKESYIRDTQAQATINKLSR